MLLQSGCPLESATELCEMWTGENYAWHNHVSVVEHWVTPVLLETSFSTELSCRKGGPGAGMRDGVSNLAPMWCALSSLSVAMPDYMEHPAPAAAASST